MARIKGSPKSGGRVKGTPNKLTMPIRDALAQFIYGKLGELPEIWDNLEPQHKIECLSKLMPYVAPKLEAISFEQSDGQDISIRISNLAKSK